MSGIPTDQQQARERRLLDSFSVVDQKKSGQIERALLLGVIKNLRATDGGLNAQELRELEEELGDAQVIAYEKFVKGTIFGEIK